ncbi:MAG: glycosyltransferase family 4 protein [Eubacterium sp.]|nr:glycosyltransferase family 4 protein [Eubacterium sp.]
MKILFYISTIRGGGAARVMTNIANAFSTKGYTVYFVTNFPDYHEYTLNGNIKRFNLEATENKQNVISKNIKRISALRIIIHNEKPDVSVSFMGENNFRLIMAAFGFATKSVVSVRNDPAKEYSSRFSKMIADFLYKRANGIVFQTEDARAAFPQKVQEKSRIIYNQVDERFYHQNENLGKYILACGRLSNQKNYPLLLMAFAELLKEFPEEQLRIYGEGTLKEELTTLTKELGIEQSVHFMGFSTDMVSIYRDAKFLVMTSDYEGMPNVILEALASSIPVISTDCPCGGPRMVIKNGVNGYLIPVGDIESLTTNMKRLLNNMEMLYNMKNNAYLSAQRFSSGNVFKMWENFILEVSSNRNR